MSDSNRPENQADGPYPGSAYPPGAGAPGQPSAHPSAAGGTPGQSAPPAGQPAPGGQPGAAHPAAPSGQPSASQQPPSSDATPPPSGSTPPPSGDSSGGSGSGSSGGSSTPEPRSRFLLWLFIWILLGGTGGVGWFTYEMHFDLQQIQRTLDELETPESFTLTAEQDERIAELQRRAEEVEETLQRAEGHTETLAEVERTLAELEGLDELRDLERQLDPQRLDRIETAMAELGQIEELEPLRERVAELEQQQSRIAELEEQIDNLGALEGDSDALARLEERMAKLTEHEEQIAQLDEVRSELDKISALESRVEQLSGVAATVDELQAQSEETAETNRQLRARLDELSERTPGEAVADELQQLRDRNEALDSRIAEVIDTQEALREQLGQLDSLSPAEEPAWFKAEARHLAQIAIHRIRYYSDVDSALAALRHADRLLAQLGGESVPARQAVDEAIDALLDYTAPKLDELRSSLVAQIEQVDDLPIRGESIDGLRSEVVVNEEPAEGLGRAWNRLREGLGTLVRVRHEDEVDRYVPPDQRFFIRENLRLPLESALLALGSGEEQTYRSSLARASEWLEKHFDGDDERVAASREQLAELAQAEIKREPPDIEALLEPVKTF